MHSAVPSKEETMSRIIRRLAVVSVLAAVIVPAAGASNFGPKDPWYLYGVSLTKQLRQEQSVKAHKAAGVQPTSPWYAYDAALRKAQAKRHTQSVKSETAGVQPTSPWYAFDAALRKAQQRNDQRFVQSTGIRVITDTLGGNGGAPARATSKTSGTHLNRFITDTLGGNRGGGGFVTVTNKAQ
jgi:hypothetical protein